MQDIGVGDEIPSFTHYGPELSRDFRGLRVWLPVKLHGLNAFRDALDEKLDLARLRVRRAAGDARVRGPGARSDGRPVQVPLPGGSTRRTGTARFSRAINASKRVFLSSTKIGGRFTLRVAILSHRSHRDRVEECVEIIKRSAADLDR